MTVVRVTNASYRNQKVEGVFKLVHDAKLGKPGRRRGLDEIWYITVDLDPSRPEFSGWGLKRNKVRLIVPGPNQGYEVIDDVASTEDATSSDDSQNLSDMVKVLDNSGDVGVSNLVT